MRVKTRSRAARTPIESKAPKRENSPNVSRSGTPTRSSGKLGVVSAQPKGLSSPPMAASRTKATIAVTTIEIRIAPLTLRTHRAISRASPAAKTSTGHPESSPPSPSCTGTVVCAASGMRVTNPASTKPISAMKRPIPTEIATLSCVGTAWKTA